MYGVEEEPAGRTSVRAWNTLTRRKEDLEPLEPPRLQPFVCGPTVSGDSRTSVDSYARASDFIPQMASPVARLVARIHAYRLHDGYCFDIARFAGYGKLAGRRKVRPHEVSRVEENPLKRHPGDFAFWKRRRSGEPS